MTWTSVSMESCQSCMTYTRTNATALTIAARSAADDARRPGHEADDEPGRRRGHDLLDAGSAGRS